MPENPSTPALLGTISRAPPVSDSARQEIESVVSQLRAEVAAANDPARRARLLGEIGEIEERGGDETAAARDYLAAFNDDATFREPLEGLVRLLERRRSLKNLAKIYDALQRSAATPEETARALLTRAAFVEETAKDLAGAKGAALEAAELPAPAAEAAQAWLMLEMLAAKLGDAPLREQALDERAKGTGDPLWRALLRLDLAAVRASTGDVDGAVGALEAAREAETEATHAALVALERLVRKEPGLAGTESAQRRAKAFAEALEAQAVLLNEATREPARGDAAGVPHWMRTPAHVADSWLRAAETRRASGQIADAARLLDKALEVVASATPEERAALEPALVSGRIRVAEQLGDTALAATLAERRLRAEKDGGVAAALAMRIAEHAASQSDAGAALEALVEAIKRDPACIPARALQLDLLADGGDNAAFAGQLEAFAEHLEDEEARGRAFLLSAFVWGTRAGGASASGGDTTGARAALERASAVHVPPITLARIARMIASIAGDAAWFEEAARRLIAASAGDADTGAHGADHPHHAGHADAPERATPSEIAYARFELVRGALARGDAEGAASALRELGALERGAWLARAVEAFLPPDGAPDPSGHTTDPVAGRRRAAVGELAAAAVESEIARGMGLIAAMRAHAAGDIPGARARLHDLAQAHGGDELIATYLADLERAAGDSEGAAAALAECAVQASDGELAAALLVEAGLERWRRSDRVGALAALEEAVTRAPGVAKLILAWAARGAQDGSVETRRAALERAGDAGFDPRAVALERFATEVAGRDDEEARSALAALEGAADADDFAIAAALGRLATPFGAADAAAVDAALARIGATGADATSFAAAERVRLALEDGPDELVDAARAWFDVGGGVPAALEWVAAAIGRRDLAGELAARTSLALSLRGAAREQLVANVTITRFVADGGNQPFVPGRSHAARLTNLELSPPGCDPRRRAEALRQVDGALGEEGETDALALAGWSMLATGNSEGALDTFTTVASRRENDLAAWEGVRLAADAAVEDNLAIRCDPWSTAQQARAVAAEMLGQLSADDARASEMWERAGLDWLDLKEGARAESAFDHAFARDPNRTVAFDKLFRLVRERKDGEKLLAITTRRLEFSEDPPEMCKLYWEQARVLREKGDANGALKALENVTILEPDHVGALALTGEIAIRQGRFEEAADALARLSSLDAAPAKNRVTAGVAAVDLFENKLDRNDRALDVLLGLHRARLTTLPVRERLARAAARTGSWREATSILEELMMERAEPAARIEAARLAMAIHRDRLGQPQGARNAVQKLLEEAPGDAEAIGMLLTIDMEPTVKRRLLERARQAVGRQVEENPTDLPLVRRVAAIGRALGDEGLWQAALSTSVALGEQDPQAGTLLLQLAARKPRTPRMALNDTILRGVLAPGDEGPVADLFAVIAPTLAEALGPSLAAAGVTKKDKVDPRAGLAIRNEIVTWAGAFGFREFDLYIGGKDPTGVVGVPGEVPSLVLGPQVNTPLDPKTRGRIARELFAMLRGSTITRWRDDTTVAAIVVAVCNIAEVRIEAPPYAMLAEVERLVSKAIARKTKKAAADVCRAVVQSRADARVWAHRALMSHNRIAAVASGDVTAVILDVTGQPLERLPALVPGDTRVEELIRFVLSPAYIGLRQALGLEGSS